MKEHDINRDLNRTKFGCHLVTAENLDDYVAALSKVKVNRNGRMIICDPLWLDCNEGLALLLSDEAARNRLRILSGKTKRNYGSDYTVSHSITTANSVMSLLLDVPIKTHISSFEFAAISELSELISVANLMQKEEDDSQRSGNVKFVDDVR